MTLIKCIQALLLPKLKNTALHTNYLELACVTYPAGDDHVLELDTPKLYFQDVSVWLFSGMLGVGQWEVRSLW